MRPPSWHASAFRQRPWRKLQRSCSRRCALVSGMCPSLQLSKRLFDSPRGFSISSPICRACRMIAANSSSSGFRIANNSSTRALKAGLPFAAWKRHRGGTRKTAAPDLDCAAPSSPPPSMNETESRPLSVFNGFLQHYRPILRAWTCRRRGCVGQSASRRRANPASRRSQSMPHDLRVPKCATDKIPSRWGSHRIVRCSRVATVV